MQTIRGVNLGNWLVLEKWMEPEMFCCSTAEDETFLCRGLNEKEKSERYDAHRKSWITKADFEQIAAAGFNLIRIPVPYFLFESFGTFVPCVNTLDQAFDWAEEFGLQLLVDLHTVPGGQNGTDNSGLCGVCTWSTKEQYRETTLDVLEKIARRYGERKALWGIEAINEPMCSDTPAGAYMNIQMLSQIYHAADPEMAKDNTNYPLSYLKDFYRDAYRRMRPHLKEEAKVVFSDAFDLTAWDDFFKEPEFNNIVLDTHQYLQMVEYGFGEDRPMAKYRGYLDGLRQQLEAVAADIPLLVGEWSLGNMRNDYDAQDPEARRTAMQELCEAYRAAIETGIGWCFWSYKLAVNEPDKDLWDVRKCLDKQWLSVK